MAINLANNNSLANITALPSSISGGAMTLLSTQTASSSATLSFTSGIDDTYDSYVFKFIDINVSDFMVNFNFNLSTDGGSNYNVTKTTTSFSSYHTEDNTGAALAYKTSHDLAQSTSDQRFNVNSGVGNGADETLCGTMILYNPSSTTFVKHFILNIPFHGSASSLNSFVAGYGNTTSAVNAIIFKTASGTFDGVIKLYGVS
jgi:hypothetical protein